jgi:hypothetical protein
MMTKGERRISDDGVERPSTGLAGQEHAPDPQPGRAEQWYRRVSFWRSVAGMAIAIALGCAAIALENGAELLSRSEVFRNRLELMGGRIVQLRSEAADAERQLSQLRAEQLARADVNRVLCSPDVLILRLTPGAGSNARGLVAISRQTRNAVLEVAGLSAAIGYTTVMWWLMAQGPPTKAAAFYAPANGRLSLTVRIPPTGARIAAAIITLEPDKSSDKPDGRIILKGVLPRPQILN